MKFLKPLCPVLAVTLVDWFGWIGWLAHETMGWFAQNKEALQGFSYFSAAICSICIGVHQFRKKRKNRE